MSFGPLGWNHAGGLGPMPFSFVLDYDPASLVLSNGDPISTWSSTGSNTAAATSSGANRPTYTTGLFNGLPGVVFDGSNDYLFTGSLTQPTDVTYFVVLDHAASQAGQTIVFGSPNRYVYASLPGGTTPHINNGAAALAAGSALSTTDGHVIAATVSATTMTISVDGGTKTTQASAAVSAGMNFYSIGSDAGSSVFNGAIGRALRADTIFSDPDVATMTAWLKAKYGTL